MPESVLFTAAQYAAWFDAQVGKPYVLGADGPNAWDCSGLVIGGNNASGAFRMGDDTAAGLYNRSRAVTGSPAVGDLVFLRNNPARSNGIGHVAVLTQKLSNGDWRIIEARGRAYGVVRTTLSYWKTRAHYTGVRRLPAFKLATATVPPVEKVTGVNVTTYNCLDPRFGGKANDDASIVNAAASSVYLLTEAPDVLRTNLRARRPGGLARWLVWERGAQAIMFDRTKWQHGEESSVVFGPTSYHGAKIAILTHKVTGLRAQFVVLHLPPSSVASEPQRKAYLDKLIEALDPNLSTVIGGDFNSQRAGEWLNAAGFDVLPTGGTNDKGKRLDYLAVRNGLHWVADAEVFNPGSASDHLAIKGKARTVPAVPTT
ncbi:MAG: endonuclease/exonuclease/phosphatase family protein [Candidatus Microthrix sp.]|nr:endonuclease/exonuclease/phosphatase family protein [Candidatus Microthrix sp.]